MRFIVGLLSILIIFKVLKFKFKWGLLPINLIRRYLKRTKEFLFSKWLYEFLFHFRYFLFLILVKKSKNI